MGLYDRQIESLELLIHNWYDIKDKDDFYKVFGDSGKGISKHHYGLCDVCQLKDLHDQVVRNMFSDWKHFSGSYPFPVESIYEFHKLKLITDNPKRLHLAVHCLQWLRQRNTINEDFLVGYDEIGDFNDYI